AAVPVHRQGPNVVLLGPLGTGKTHLSIGLAIAAAQRGHRVLFATAVDRDRVARLQTAHQHGRLAAELAKLRRYALLIVDEVGYILSSKTRPTCPSNWSRPDTNTPR